eukprot:758622-Prorocentrum_lima.AAC.1
MGGHLLTTTRPAFTLVIDYQWRIQPVPFHSSRSRECAVVEAPLESKAFAANVHLSLLALAHGALS